MQHNLVEIRDCPKAQVKLKNRLVAYFITWLMVFVSGEKLVTLDPHDPGMMTLNHSLGTSPVTYDTAGWIKACRNHPSSEQAVTLLNSSQKYVYMGCIWCIFYILYKQS